MAGFVLKFTSDILGGVNTLNVLKEELRNYVYLSLLKFVNVDVSSRYDQNGIH